MIVHELRRLGHWEERHRRLIARLLLVLVLTAVVDLVGMTAIYFLERHARGGDIHTFGDAAFFTTVQLLTVSSQITNPLTAGGRLVDIGLEIWAVIVVAGSAGAIASFFQTGDR
jgi:voltage-gated potassium channel